jgi:hypothetical protein
MPETLGGLEHQKDDQRTGEVSRGEDLHDPCDGIKPAHDSEGFVGQIELLFWDAAIASHWDDVSEADLVLGEECSPCACHSPARTYSWSTSSKSWGNLGKVREPRLVGQGEVLCIGMVWSLLKILLPNPMKTIIVK